MCSHCELEYKSESQGYGTRQASYYDQLILLEEDESLISCFFMCSTLLRALDSPCENEGNWEKVAHQVYNERSTE